MRFELFVGGILAAGLVMTAAACGSSESSGTNPDDGSGGETNGSSSGGSSSGASSGASSSGETSSSGGSSSGGSSSGGLTAKELAKGFVTISGIAGDQVIYQAVDTGGVTLNAVPIAGGAPTKISDMVQGDRAVVSGGAVGLWRTVTNGIGTFSVWTKTAGLKEGPGTSLVGLFTATDDGSRIAFSVSATSTSSRIAVLDPATVTAATTYNGGDNGAINIASTCLPRLRFAGKTFVGAYCTSISAVRARLVVMADGATTFDSVVSNSTNASGIQPYFQLSKDNTKVMVLGLPDTEAGVTADEQLRIVTLPAGATQVVDTDVYDGVLNADGSAVIYQTGTGALKRASTGATPSPVEILPAGTVKSVEEYSSDRARVLFDSTEPDADTGAVDLKTATTAAAVSPADVATAAQSIGFNGAETHFVFVKESATGATLLGKPVAGGADKDLFTDPEIVLVQPTAAGVIVGHDSKETTLGSQKIPVFSLTTVDMAATKKLVATDIPEGEWAFKDKTLVYSRLVVSGTAIGAGTGLFAVTLP
jgi:hypothetical protein